jgi:hypothetical protein
MDHFFRNLCIAAAILIWLLVARTAGAANRVWFMADPASPNMTPTVNPD